MFIKKLSEEQDKEAVKLYQSGTSVEQIARQYGVGRAAVRNALYRQKYPTRSRAEAGAVKNPDRFVELWDSGMTVKEIEHVTGRNRVTIYKYLRRAGKDLFNRGQRHHLWKGGAVIDSSGHRRVLLRKDDPFYSMVNSQGYVLEHRLAMARKLGRPLKRNETVHHLDGDRLNNAPDNLQLRSGRHGKGTTHQCLDCGSYNVAAVSL